MTTEETTEKKTGMPEGRMAFMIYLIIVGVLILGGTVYYNVFVRDYPAGTPTDKGNVTAVGPLHLQLPKDWKVSTIDNVTYAAPPSTDCKPADATCKTIAVHDARTFKPGNWQANTAGYNCPTNANESPAAPVERSTIQIGKDKLGAYQRTLELCGMSKGHTLNVYEVQVPPVLIIVKTTGNPKQTLPGIEQLLKSDATRIG